MKESKIESLVCGYLHKQGCNVHKLTGRKGDPDRVVIWRDDIDNARVFYLELKTETGRATRVQKFRHNKLIGNVYICRSVDDAENALNAERGYDQPMICA